MTKYFCSLSIADKDWTDEQRTNFECSIFNSLGAERQEAFGNLYTFEVIFQHRNEAREFVTQYIAIAFLKAEVEDINYYLTMSNTRGMMTHMSV